MRDWFLTSAGTVIDAVVVNQEPAPGRDAEIVSLDVSSSGGEQRVNVTLDKFALQTVARGFSVILSTPEIAVVRVLDEIGRDAGFLDQAERAIDLKPSDAHAFTRRDKLQDKAIRRYIARRSFENFKRKTLKSVVEFDNVDLVTVGGLQGDLLRNLEVLEDDDYVVIVADAEALAARPTAKLVRDVERFGAAREDTLSEADYTRELSLYPHLASHQDALVAEHRRYLAAQSDTELTSVYRAVAPIVESVVRELLQAHGSSGHMKLGPMINELRSRQLVSAGVVSELNHIIKFPRDLAGHGQEVPVSVLRIASAVAFELIPKLGAAFPT